MARRNDAQKELAKTITFPAPTHWIALPPGYEGSRAVALKLLAHSSTHGPDEFWKSAPEADQSLPAAITAREALQDLPVIDARAEFASGTLRSGTRRFDTPLPYPAVDKLTACARAMRTWPGFEAREAVFDHVIRYLPRDYNLFARLNPGDQYPEAYHHAETMFEEALAERHRKQPRYRRRVIIAERWLKEDTRIKFPDRPGRENRVCFS